MSYSIFHACHSFMLGNCNLWQKYDAFNPHCGNRTLIFWVFRCPVIFPVALPSDDVLTTDHPLGNLYHGPASIISLSYQGLEKSPTKRRCKMDSICLHKRIPVWVARSRKSISPFCHPPSTHCSTKSGRCKALFLAIYRYTLRDTFGTASSNYSADVPFSIFSFGTMLIA